MIVPACPATYDPVQATDGRVYDNECLARVAGVAVVKRVSATRPAAVGDLFDPVQGFVPGLPNVALFAGAAAVAYVLYARGKRRGAHARR